MDPQSDAEKIRNKRLAKLQAQQTSSSSSSPKPDPEASSSTTPAEQSRPAPEPKKEAAPPSAPAPKISVKPLSPQPSSSMPKQSAKKETPEEWANRTLASIFRVTLQEGQSKDAQGNKLYFLPKTKQELADEGRPLMFDVSILDQVILEAAEQAPEAKPLKYLIGCWKRVMRLWRAVQTAKQEDHRHSIISEAKRLCLSYATWTFTMPDIFGIEEPKRSPLLEHLLCDQEDDFGICPDFLTEIANQTLEDESVKEGFLKAIHQMSNELKKKNMNDDFKPYVTALRLCIRYAPLTAAITESPNFLRAENITADRIERDTILGPFFALSPLKPEVAVNYFTGANVQGQSYILNSQNAVRLTLRTLQDELFEIANSIIKSAKGPREKFLDWLAVIVNKNHKRRAIWLRDKEVSTDGFMVNITTILDRLCEPFMDATFQKLDRIDPNYLRRSPRVNIDDETKINADQNTSDEFYAEKDGKENNFISEIFFLTVAAHHYGSEAANNRVSQLQREVKQMERDVEQLEGMRQQFSSEPLRLAMLEMRLKQAKETVEKVSSVIEAIKGVLLDEVTQQRSMLLMRYIIAWLLRLVQPESQYPKKPVRLPLAKEQPLIFRCLPEYFLEDIVDNFKFTTQHIPHLILPTQCEELVNVCVTFLRSTEYVKNPGIKSGLVTILFFGIYPVPNRPKGILGDLLNGMEFCHQNLLQGLMQFYIEAESTGTHTQFYDKFNIRYEIFQVMKSIWDNSIYRTRLDKESKENPDFFVQFVNLLLNDVTYILGESFRAFNKIHELQELLETPNNGLDENEAKEKEELLEEQKRVAKNHMQLTNETISMLKLFTEALPEAFTVPELVQRLADMLDYNLESMVGPKQKNLKVQDPDQYHFKPRFLLSDLMSIYINLKDQQNFVVAVARDGRSYKPGNFEQAGNIMVKTGLKSGEELESWQALSALIAKTKELEDQAEEDLGEIPDEFLDPLLATLMEDPVILPSSKVIIDRSTIRSHLLSDPQDPFNRQPLKIEDVIPATEIKEKIEKFKADARDRKLAALADAMDGDRMELDS